MSGAEENEKRPRGYRGGASVWPPTGAADPTPPAFRAPYLGTRSAGFAG